MHMDSHLPDTHWASGSDATSKIIGSWGGDWSGHRWVTSKYIAEQRSTGNIFATRVDAHWSSTAARPTNPKPH